MLCNTLIAFGDVLGQRASLPHNVLFAVVWVLCRAPRAAGSADSGCRAHGPFYFVRYSTSEDSCKNSIVLASFRGTHQACVSTAAEWGHTRFPGLGLGFILLVPLDPKP